MKKCLGLIVLAGSVAVASLAAAQIPVPAATPAPTAPAPLAAAVPQPPAPPAFAAPPPAAPPVLVTPGPAPVAAPAPPQAPVPVAAPTQAPQAPPRPAATPKPAKPPRTPEAPEAPAPPAQPEPPSRENPNPDPVNVRFEVTVSSQTGTAAAIKRSAVVTVSNGGNSGPTGSGMLRSGNNIPVPTTTLTTRSEDGKETAAARPLTSYSYRSVGLNVDVSNVLVLPGNRVRASMNVEFSGIDDKSASTIGAPSFPTFSQRLSLFFDSGKPLLVAQSSDYVDNLERKQTVEVKATVLR